MQVAGFEGQARPDANQLGCWVAMARRGSLLNLSAL